MQNAKPQRGSRLLLALLGLFVSCICLTLAGIFYLALTTSVELANQFSTDIARVAPKARGTVLPSAPNTATAEAWEPTLQAIRQTKSWFHDDFETTDPKSGWGLGTYKSKNVEGWRAIEHGVYHYNLNATNGFSWHSVPNMLELADEHIQLRVKQDDQTRNAGQGIIFRYKDNNNYYRFLIRPDRTFTVDGLHNGDWETYISDLYSMAILPYDWNELQVNAVGSRFSFWINDTYVGSAVSSRIASGRAGVGLEMSAGQQATFDFDDFQVYRVSIGFETATPTPGPTLTPTPLVPTSWHTVLNESFTKPDHGWAVGERNTATERVVRTIKNGGYNWIVANTAADGEWVTVPEMSPLGDFLVTTPIQGLPDAQVGFVFGYVDDNNYTRFIVARDGTYRAENKRNGTWLLLFRGQQNSNIASKAPHNLAVKRLNGIYQFLVNDNLVASRPESTIRDGKVGLTVLTARGVSTTFSFANFLVQAP